MPSETFILREKNPGALMLLENHPRLSPMITDMLDEIRVVAEDYGVKAIRVHVEWEA